MPCLIPLRRTALALGIASLTGCGILPNGGPNLNPDPTAIVSRETNGRTTTLTYDKVGMNRAEAEVYAQQVCEEDGLTLDVLRHPAPAPGLNASVIFTCRRPYG